MDNRVVDLSLPIYNAYMSKDKIVFVIVGIVLIAGIIYFGVFSNEKNKEEEALKDVSQALDQATLETKVPVSANPVKEAAGAVNPLEKTNPFKNQYANPFE